MNLDNVYDYLCTNYSGKKNGEKRAVIAQELCIKPRDLRRVLSEINSNQSYNRLISTKDKIYACETEKECCESINATFRAAFTLLRKARCMQKKLGLDGQKYADEETIKEIVAIFEK